MAVAARVEENAPRKAAVDPLDGLRAMRHICRYGADRTGEPGFLARSPCSCWAMLGLDKIEHLAVRRPGWSARTGRPV